MMKQYVTTLLIVLAIVVPTTAFQLIQDVFKQTREPLYGSRDCNGFSTYDFQLLKHRLMGLRMQVLETEFKRPPNSELSPEEFVREILRGLWDSNDPLPDSGFRLLLRSSTKDWRNKIYAAVGAPDTAKEEDVAATIGTAISRPKNQYNILVAEAEEYNPYFPSDTAEHTERSCWIECQLRGKEDNRLLANTGWQLEMDEQGAWLISRIDWQDFRDEYRPGVGREEWVCVA
jgi:hypothetical protein